MSGTNTIAFGRNAKVYVVKESTPGTLVIPASANLVVHNSFEIEVGSPAWIDDEGVRNSRSRFKRYTGPIPGAAWKLGHYVRPSGSAGTAPEGDPLFEAALGTKTVSGGVSVAYTPAATLPSLSIYIKDDHTVWAAAGCHNNKLMMKKDNKGLLVAEHDGKAMKTIWTGTGALAEAISTTPAPGTEEWFSVDDNKKFCVGSHVLIDTEQMQVTGTYWEGSTGASAGKIKLKRGYNSSTVATHLNAAAITPWLPTGTELGEALTARVGTLTFDAVSAPILDAEWNVENNIAQNEDEVTGSDWPTDYYEGDRKVSGKVGLYFRRADLKYLADGMKQTRKAVVINYGSVNGKKVAITSSYCELNMPKPPNDKSVQRIEMEYSAFASAGNDETELKFL